MTGIDHLLNSFEQSWKEFSTAWKKARSSASEESIHDLRVNVRRLIATIGLTRVLSRHNESEKVQKRFKRILKSMGRLRDVQVQLQNVALIRQTEASQDFIDNLKRREEREIAKIEKKLKRAHKSKLSEDVTEVRGLFKHLRDTYDQQHLTQRIETAVSARQKKFRTCQRRFKPEDIETLHAMRIALKQLRYVVEAAQSVLGPSAKQHARKMQELQRLMGDTRDLTLLSSELDKWASRKGKKLAVVPALEDLREKREQLMRKIGESASNLEDMVPLKALKPKTERTAIAVAAAAGQATGGAGEPALNR